MANLQLEKIKARCDACKRIGEPRTDGRCAVCFLEACATVLENFLYGATVGQVASIIYADEAITRYHLNKLVSDNRAIYAHPLYFLSEASS